MLLMEFVIISLFVVLKLTFVEFLKIVYNRSRMVYEFFRNYTKKKFVDVVFCSSGF